MTTRIADAGSFLFGAWRMRPRGKRVLTAAALVLMLTGTAMFTYPIFTDLYWNFRQNELEEAFAAPDLETRFSAGAIGEGEVLTRVKIPSIGVDALIVEGTTPVALRAGAGHYRSTALPCAEGNVGIAGHRTTYGKPFNRLDELRVGDRIELITPEGTCAYRVTTGDSGKRVRPGAAGWVTHPRDGKVLRSLPGRHLTLTTCHPKGSAAKRLIIRAELIEG